MGQLHDYGLAMATVVVQFLTLAREVMPLAGLSTTFVPGVLSLVL